VPAEDHPADVVAAAADFNTHHAWPAQESALFKTYGRRRFCSAMPDEIGGRWTRCAASGDVLDAAVVHPVSSLPPIGVQDVRQYRAGLVEQLTEARGSDPGVG